MAELAYCVPIGLPHSVFLGWSEDDQDKALIYMMAKAQVCEMCGSREAEWVDPETGRLLQVPPLTPVGMKCHGCAEIDQYRKNELNNETPPGVRIVLVDTESVNSKGELKRN